jgi:hypothetical protein
MATVTEVQGERTRALALVGLIKVTIAGAIAAAAWRNADWTVIALAASLVAEVVTAQVSPYAVAAMRRASAGAPVRAGLRLLAVVLLAGRSLSPHVLVETAVAAALITGIMIGIEAASLVIERARRLPLVTRNVPTGGLALPKPVPAIVRDPKGGDALAPAIAALGLAISIHHGAGASWAIAGLSIALAVVALPAFLLVVQLLLLVRGNLRTKLTEAAMDAVGSMAPEVVLYFAASVDELYQLRMWLEPLAKLDRQVAIVVRSYEAFDALADVPFPVIATPYNGTIAALPLPDRVVGLFVTHTGNNLSLLRRPEIRSVFIGHGDSDKPDSVNPFARVYDEVWVAGALGRRRYALADVGVRESALVEIGRPQITVASTPPATPPTIVYAPTWEGWGDDPHHSSIPHVGVELVERLSARGDVRVRYRPHPLTGRRSAALRAAHQRILGLVGRVPPDEPIAETFAASSGLIGDVSSVINEYLPYDRPYAVIDTRDLGRAEFVKRFPSTAGGFVVAPGLDQLDEFVAAVRGGADVSRTARRELLADALGDPATAQRRFAASVDRLLL